MLRWFRQAVVRVRDLLRMELLLWMSWMTLVQKCEFAISRCGLIFQPEARWGGARFQSDNRVGLFLLPTYLQEVELLLNHVSAEKNRPFRIIDVGANCGQFSLTVVNCLRQRGFQAEVLCLEPNPTIHALLLKNISASPNSSSFLPPINAAVSRSSGEVQLHFVAGKSAQGSFSATAATANLIKRTQASSVTVSTISLTDSHIRKYWPDGLVDLVKIDVEGSEDEVLVGIRECKLRYAWIETPHSSRGELRTTTAELTRSLELEVVTFPDSQLAVSTHGNILLCAHRIES